MQIRLPQLPATCYTNTRGEESRFNTLLLPTLSVRLYDEEFEEVKILNDQNKNSNQNRGTAFLPHTILVKSVLNTDKNSRET